MGIINITDDSYFAPSRVKGDKEFLQRLTDLLNQGADIIDIGACSTRPGSHYISEQQEIEKISTILPLLREFPSVTFSFDTFRSKVVEIIYDSIGDFIVNDISSSEEDSLMLPTIGKLKLRYIAMHKRGTPSNMQQQIVYNNITDDIIDYFSQFDKKAVEYGVTDYMIDPGFGFSKTVEQNYELLSNLDRLKTLGKKILVGISRKSMIYRPLESDPQSVLHATSALHLYSLLHGADLLRVHDVKEAKEIITLFSYLCKQDINQAQ